MAKPSVYVETTIVGHLTAHIHSDLVIAGRQYVTREWWSTAQLRFRLVVSQLVADECAAGDATAAADRMEVIRNLAVAPQLENAELLARRLIERNAVPRTEPRDALHIAIATANKIDYLVTWNFRHIANASTRHLIERICQNEGFDAPAICTPEEL